MICAFVVLPGCMSYRHHALTKRTQKWEKEHFDPDRKVSKKGRKAMGKVPKSTQGTKRVG